MITYSAMICCEKRRISANCCFGYNGAFDNLWNQILKQLKDKNCPKNLYIVIRVT